MSIIDFNLENKGSSNKLNSISNLIFSYKIKQSPSHITLKQNESNSCMEINFLNTENLLQVTKFQTTLNEKLEIVSESLADAAMIELVLESLKFIFSFASKKGHQKISFILPEEEADHLIDFNIFVKNYTSQMTREGRRIILSLFCFPEYEDYLYKQSQSLKNKIKCELWKLQREDFHVKDYLQNNKRGETLEYCKDMMSSKDTILPLFPNKEDK